MRQIWLIALLAVVACASPRSGTDFTKNRSRSASPSSRNMPGLTVSSDAIRIALAEYAESLIGARYR
ncbi:MAG: hypothetical protein R3330_12180, partial [Saprospiraceae bacterium]|nr:hypothetical protein [Saprospiraceae bacterium]